MTARHYGALGIIGVGGWVLINLLLHVLDTEMSVVDNVMSEYALGEYGWLTAISDFSNAIGLFAIGLGLRAALPPGKGVAASGVLVAVAGVGFVVSGVFLTDETGAEEVTLSGGLHLLGFFITVISLIIAAWKLRGVFARSEGWQRFARPQHWFAVVFSTMLVAFMALGEASPGIPQRILALVLASWLIALAMIVRNAPPIPVGNKAEARVEA